MKKITTTFNSTQLILATVFLLFVTTLKAQVATGYAKAYNEGTKFGQYVIDTKTSILIIENTHDSRPIMCTYIIQDKEFAKSSDEIKTKTGHTEKIYPGEKFLVYKGPVYKFVYIKKAWFVPE